MDALAAYSIKLQRVWETESIDYFPTVNFYI